MNYTVWSDVLICPNCGAEIIFWDNAIDEKAGKVLDTFACSNCLAETTKRQCTRATVTRFDDAIEQTITQAKQIPVLINYSVKRKRHQRRPQEMDTTLVTAIDNLPIPYWFPTDRMPEGDESRRNDPQGITHTHHFYTKRNLFVISSIRLQAKCSSDFSSKIMFWSTGADRYLSRMAKLGVTYFFSGKGGAVNAGLLGTLYIPSFAVEYSVLENSENRLPKLIKSFCPMFDSISTIQNTGTASNVLLHADSVNYIFTDPPFGGNIMYSELNFLWEAWLGIQTNNVPEAITNFNQKKKLPEYQALMTRSFAEYYRVLKPGRWMTVEFHNSANAVWNAIQEGLERVGFVVADVRVLSKQQGTFKQVTSSGAVKEDLVISCYKPGHEFEERFKELQGKPEGVVEFLREHLAMLPVAPINKAGHLETVAEWTRFLLFDRMVAYHLQHGARIPLSAADFYKLLEEQFVERDAMYFLNAQSARYDAIKARGVETEQLSIFVRDEKTAVQWIRARLSETPQTLGDLTPQLMQELREWENHEPRPELRDLLKEYFVEESGIWHVPDPNNEKDLEAMRRNALLRLFREYTTAKPPLKVFRKEAVLEGFRHCWETQQYGVIVAVCEKIPEKILQEIQEFVMMYDVSKDLAPTQEPQTAFIWE